MDVMHTCKIHGLTLHNKKSAKLGYGTICKKCTNQYTYKRRLKVRQRLVNLLGGCCEVCGYSRALTALEFHHKDPTQKEFNLSAGVLTKSWASLEREAKKCMLLCANCHREVEENLLRSINEVDYV